MEAESFHHVFMNHVLEHFHDPRTALAEVARLLVPGGRLWLTQPNLGALGLARFGAYWRGLEPPRHLSLYTRARLSTFLAETGFEKIRTLPPADTALFYFRQSQAMRDGIDPNGPVDPPGWTDEILECALSADRRARRKVDLGESLTMIAWKPAD
jgi:SAM-dependent methyltransferase